MRSKAKRGIECGQTQGVAVFNGACCTFDQYVAAQEGGFGNDGDRADRRAHKRGIGRVQTNGGCGIIFSN